MPRPLHWGSPGMMMTRGRIMFALLLLAACNRNASPEADPAHPIAASPPNVRIAARRSAVLGEYVSLTFHNSERFAVCFSSSNLLPGRGTTFVRDSERRILNDESNPALEEFRGVNLAGPVTVLRPGGDHRELLNLEPEGFDWSGAAILQVGISVFRCADLFDNGSGDVPQTLIEKAFSIQPHSIAEYVGPQLDNGQESPPGLSNRPPQ
jgi:hypothetical protein